MAKVFIIGGGGHAKVLISVLKKAGYDIGGYTDTEDHGSILGIPHLGSDAVLKDVVSKHQTPHAVIGIGRVDASHLRLGLQDRLTALGFGFPVICSPNAIVNEGVRLGDGTVVLDGAIIGSGTEIGRACIINTNSVVEHDCQLGENVHIGPGVTICGGVVIGDNCMIGAGSSIVQSTRVFQGCLIGAGSTVIEDITASGTYVGNPTRKIR